MNDRDIFRSAPKPLTFTSERFVYFKVPYVTIKLDGIRALILCDHSGTRVITSQESYYIDREPKAYSLYDSEFILNTYFIFDAAWCDGADLRNLPLPARLKAIMYKIPASCALKRYHWNVDKEKLEKLLNKTFRVGRTQVKCEGLIIVDSTLPYHTCPLKFKRQITCDFILRYDGAINLFVHNRGTLVKFEHESIDNSVDVKIDELGIQDAKHLNKRKYVAELELINNKWKFLKRRPDRNYPNSLACVNENISITLKEENTLEFLTHEFINKPAE